MPRSLPQSRVKKIIPSYRGTHPADLAARRLAEVPSHVLQHVELNKLLLDNNKLSSLPDEMKLMTCLEGLFLQFNNIERLPPQLFSISALSVLVLDSNCLTRVPDDIGHLQQLTVLSMESNRLKMLPDGLMQCLALHQLNVRNNELAGLPVSINLLTALQVLDASMNRLAWLPSLNGMTRLTQLQLSYNLLKTLHFSVSSLVSLNMICLEHNSLKQLPPEIFYCPKVSALIASHNEIELLPRNIHLSYHLTDVQLHCNQLVTLDPSLFASTSITSLRLDSNMITNLPDDVASASSLQTLNISFNPLHRPPTVLCALTSLETLTYHGCPWVSFIWPPKPNVKKGAASKRCGCDPPPPEIAGLAPLHSLMDIFRRMHILSFSGRGLTRIPEETFAAGFFRTLSLDDNAFTELPDSLRQLTSLLELQCRRCRLHSLPSCIPEMHLLSTLRVGGNVISLLPPSLFQSTSITVLGLGDNKICSLPPALLMMTQLQCNKPYPKSLELLGNPLAASFIACIDRESSGLATSPQEATQLVMRILRNILAKQGTSVISPQLTHMHLLVPDNHSCIEESRHRRNMGQALVQSFGTVITGRVDLVKFKIEDQDFQDSERVIEVALEWNFGCMDLDWLRRYCKTQVEGMFLMARARNAAPIQGSSAIAALLPSRVISHLGLDIPVVQRAHWARCVTSTAVMRAVEVTAAQMPQVPQMQFGWEFKVNAIGRTWYEHAELHQVQLWRPELHKDEEFLEEEEDPEDAAQREAAAATAALTELILSLQIRQADLVASITTQQSKLESLTKALKVKKGDALKMGQAQQQALDKEIKDMQKDLTATKAQIADAQKHLPATSKSVANDSQPKDQSSVVSGKTVLTGSRSKPISRANTMVVSKNVSSSTSSNLSASARPAPVSRSSTVTSVASASITGSLHPVQKPAAKISTSPVAEIKEFGRAVETLDSKLLSISDEVCLDVDEQMWAPIKKLSFLPVVEKHPVNSTILTASPADNKKSASSSFANSPSKTTANKLVKVIVTPVSRSSSYASGSAIPSPLSSARK